MTERPYTAATIEDIWIPGRSLDYFYPIPVAEELAIELHASVPGNYVALNEIFGSIRIPSQGEKVESVVSIDLCEVMRLTARAIAATGGKDHDGNNYIEGLWEDSRFKDEDGSGSHFADYTLQPIAQVLINHDLVEPVEGADQIARIIQTWRKDGAYCVANTSTLPGCELGTVRFLNRYFPGCFDGIIFPRNHDGTSQTTKADALSHILTRLADDNHNPDFVMHVDDMVHHVQSMLEKKPHDTMYCFLPVYADCVALEALSAEVKRADSPVEVFRLMDEHFNRTTYTSILD